MTDLTSEDPPIRIGVAVHEQGDEGEDALAAFVDMIRHRPARVGGLYQQTVRVQGAPNRMSLVDVATGETVSISQPLGSGSSACCLDPTGLAEGAARLRQVREAGVDLLIVSKFGRAEAEGHGLGEELFAAACEGTPVLVLVSARYLDLWHKASGGLGETLRATPEAMLAWYERLGIEQAGSAAKGAVG